MTPLRCVAMLSFCCQLSQSSKIFLEASAAINHRYLSVCGKKSFFLGKKVGFGFFVIRQKWGDFSKS